MGLVPDTKTGKVQFYQSKIAAWTANAVAIGTSASEVSALDAKVTAAADAIAAQLVAKSAAETATATADEAVALLATAGADIIRQIRAKGAIVGQSVYDLAQIPAPATPAPVGAPGLPHTLKAELKPNGTLELKWKCSNPAGCTSVIYQVYRKVEATGEYHYLGGSGSKRFVDATLPAGVPSVMYQIQGTRSTSVGDAAEFVVNFGVTGSTGTMTASVTSAQGAKIAA